MNVSNHEGDVESYFQSIYLLGFVARKTNPLSRALNTSDDDMQPEANVEEGYDSGGRL